MRMVIPAIVTHPCTLFRDGLRQILLGTWFKPVHLAADFDDAAINHLSSAETSLWLLGLERCEERTFDLIRRVCAATSGLKAVILAQGQIVEDVSSAIEAGASGFLCQDISRERLIKSLELIALGEIVVPAAYLHAVGARASKPAQLQWHPKHNERMPSTPAATGEMVNGKEHPIDEELIKGLSKRETSILRLLTQGASNKVIARQLVITEATVKAHLKAILRKLRLHNRTQAAMWASNHLDVHRGNGDATGGLSAPASDHLKTPRPNSDKPGSNGDR
jgi:two-component system, NarL family, nitrate/nitrite response regulator NarL